MEAFFALSVLETAVILAVPAAFALTTPLEDTVATFVLEDFQVTDLLNFPVPVTVADSVTFPPFFKYTVFVPGFCSAAFTVTFLTEAVSVEGDGTGEFVGGAIVGGTGEGFAGAFGSLVAPMVVTSVAS